MWGSVVERWPRDEQALAALLEDLESEGSTWKVKSEESKALTT